MTATHRDTAAVASVAQWPEIQPLVSRGQIVSADLVHGLVKIVNVDSMLALIVAHQSRSKSGQN